MTNTYRRTLWFWACAALCLACGLDEEDWSPPGVGSQGGTNSGAGGGTSATGGDPGGGGPSGGASDGGSGGTGGGASSSRTIFTGTLDPNGDANVVVPEINVDDMPFVLGYVYSSAYAEPGYVPLGNIIPESGRFRFAAGATNAGAPYVLVVIGGLRSVYEGRLDTEGNAAVVVPEIVVDDMPLALGYVFTSSYAEPGYVALGGIIPGNGAYRFAAGAGNANCSFVVVVPGTPRALYTGSLDAGGAARVTVADLKMGDFPAILGYVFTTGYAEAGYVALGNIIPGDGQFLFSAGAANAGAAYRLVVGF